MTKHSIVTDKNTLQNLVTNLRANEQVGNKSGKIIINNPESQAQGNELFGNLMDLFQNNETVQNVENITNSMESNSKDFSDLLSSTSLEDASMLAKKYNIPLNNI